MIATIENYDAVAKGYVIVCRDEEGNTVERITASDIYITSKPWPCFVLEEGNKMRMIR
jgi:hypothetical protein